jgi:prophage regulatory protein
MFGSNPVAPAGVEPTGLMDVNDVAEHLDCSSRHVYRLRDKGLMPPSVKLGGLVRWSRKAINEWVESGCKPCRPKVRK